MILIIIIILIISYSYFPLWEESYIKYINSFIVSKRKPISELALLQN